MANRTPDQVLWRAARKLSRDLAAVKFGSKVTVYDPLEYAGKTHREYLRRYGSTRKQIVFLGMNPGPWGMAQTGVPFGHVGLVCAWLGISGNVREPPNEHAKYPVLGFACHRSEGSGARLWGLAKERYKTPERFFRERFVANYCPLLFIANDKNLVPEKLPSAVRDELYKLCNLHLEAVIHALDPEFVIGVGKFARKRAEVALASTDITVLGIPHPSPASPAANRGWAAQVDAKLKTYELVF